MSSFTKTPSEIFTIRMDFTAKLPTGTTIQSGTVSAINATTGADDNSVLESTTADVSDTEAQARVKLGVHGEDYKISFVVTLDNTDVLEEPVTMLVRD
jgi:hypothetical protein